jgi:hypothetical protein
MTLPNSFDRSAPGRRHRALALRVVELERQQRIMRVVVTALAIVIVLMLVWAVAVRLS